jgi:predicted ATP-dependent endonuclease of OLD family
MSITTIKKIRIRNFKCIKDLEIELAPLTIFVGPNGSGKSSILEALALMSQCSKRNVPIISESAIKGGEDSLVEYDEVRSILYKRRIDKIDLSLGITASIPVEELKAGITTDLNRFQDIAYKQPPNVSTSPIFAYLDFLRKLNLNKTVFEITYSFVKSNSIFLHDYIIEGNRIYYGYDSEYSKYISEPVQSELRPVNSDIFLSTYYVSGYSSEFSSKLVEAFKKRLSKIYYLSAERGYIPWSYEAKERKHEWVGRRGEYTIEILAELMKPENDEKRLPYEILCEKFGIKYVWAGWDHGNYLTSNYVDPYLGSAHKFPSLGYGSRQLLSIIAQLAYSDPGSIILIEEPEISLHPSYQRLLPVLFGRAVNEGKQILVTTHSSYFVLSLDIVLEGYKIEGQTTRGYMSYEVKLSPSDIAVYHVTRDEKEGYTKVEKLELDERGLKEGISSFINVEREILEKFIIKE